MTATQRKDQERYLEQKRLQQQAQSKKEGGASHAAQGGSPTPQPAKRPGPAKLAFANGATHGSTGGKTTTAEGSTAGTGSSAGHAVAAPGKVRRGSSHGKGSRLIRGGGYQHISFGADAGAHRPSAGGTSSNPLAGGVVLARADSVERLGGAGGSTGGKLSGGEGAKGERRSKDKRAGKGKRSKRRDRSKHRSKKTRSLRKSKRKHGQAESDRISVSDLEEADAGLDKSHTYKDGGLKLPPKPTRNYNVPPLALGKSLGRR